MTDFKRGKPRYGLFLFLLLLCCGVAAIDMFAGSQISPWAFYLLPIGLGGWLGGHKVGFAISLAATGLIFLSAYIYGHPFANWFYFAISVSNRVVTFLVVAFLSSYLWEVLDHLKKLSDDEKI